MSIRSLCIVMLLFCYVSTLSYAQEVVLDESFETIALKTKPNWLTNLTQLQCQVASASPPQGKATNQQALHVHVVNSNDFWSMELPVASALTGSFTVQFKVMFPAVEKTDVKLLMLGPTGQGPYLRMRPASSDAGFSTYDSAFHPLLVKIMPKQWYQVVLKVDLNAQTFSARVDNLDPQQAGVAQQHVKAVGLKFSALSHQSPPREITKINVSRVSNDSANVLLDDVQIVSTQPTTALPARPKPVEVADNDIALNKPYTMTPRPTYSLTADADDAVQLTDGLTTKALVKSTGHPMWFHKSAVGWQNVREPIDLTLDLGDIQPIDSVVVHSCYGRSGVTSPFAIMVFISEDGNRYHPVGNLVPDVMPDAPESGYVQRAYRKDGLNISGRYVRLIAMAGGPYLFMDEVEVLRGHEGQTAHPIHPAVTDPMAYFKASKLDLMVRRRLGIDLQKLEALSGQPAPAQWKQAVLSGDLHTDQVVLRNGLPYNDLHRKIWSAIGQARVGISGDSQTLVIQAVNPWEPVLPLEGPSDHPLSQIEVNVCNGEYRSAAINITNNSTESATVEIAEDLKKQGLPAELLQMHQAIYVDTKDGVIISAPLSEVPKQGEQWTVQVPAGSTRQVWLTLNPREVDPGTHKMLLSLQSQQLKTHVEIPLVLNVFPLDFPAQHPALSATLWDYAQPSGSYVNTPSVVPSAVKLMREHFIRNTWAGSWIIPWPRVGTELNRDGSYAQEIASKRWSALDQWIALWPDAEHFCIFVAAGPSMPLSGFKANTPEFDAAISGLFQRLLDRFAKHGVEAARVAICFVDEPKNDGQEQLTLSWDHAARMGNKDYLLFSDPVRHKPDQMLPEFVEAVDIFCPNVDYLLDPKKEALRSPNVGKIFQKASAGKTLWMYQCIVPVPGLDPYRYHRMTAWRCFQFGATGMGFWALGANGHHDNRSGSWDTFTPSIPAAATAFWDDQGIVTTKYLEAMREGVEDYEWLAAFAQAIRDCPDVQQAARLQAKLDSWVSDTTGQYTAESILTQSKEPRTQADSVRSELLPLLVKLREKQP